MKVLQVINSLDAASGGPVEGLIQQGMQMALNGHEVHTVSLDAPGQVIDQRIASQAVYLLGPRWLKYGFVLRLEPWLRVHGHYFDVIVVHGMWQYTGYCVNKVARSLGLRYVVFLHGMLDPWFARRYPLKHLKKWLYWPWAEYRILRQASAVLFTSAEEMRLARQSFGLYTVREKLVGYGISARPIPLSSAKERFLKRFPQLDGKRNLLYLSRIHPKKGCDLLIQAFASVAHGNPDLHLVIAGPDPLNWRAQLMHQAKDLGIQDRLTFTGLLLGDMKWGAYDAAEVFVLPSHQENFGIVVAEALASGKAVLTTFAVNIWLEIQEAGAGFIDLDTAEGTERSLRNWLALTPAERGAMEMRAVACFEENFEIGRVTRNLLDVLEGVARGHVGEHTFRGRLFGSTHE